MKLDLAELVAVVTDHDGQPWPYLQATDGTGLVDLAAGPDATVEQAILGAQRLATAALQLADELRAEATARALAVPG